MTHPTSDYENHGCRCDTCTAAHRQRVASDRAQRAATRTLIDGRLVATDAPTHGTNGTYTNWCCRCEPCTAAGSGSSMEWQRSTRARRHATRVLIDGRMVAVDAPNHGSATTYLSWGCRCEVCTTARAVEQAAYRERRRAT